MAQLLQTKIRKWYNDTVDGFKASEVETKENIRILDWAGSRLCSECFGLFVETRIRKQLLSKHGYERAQSYVVTAAARGCTFCGVLDAAFRETENTSVTPNEPPQDSGDSAMLILYAVNEKSINGTRRPVDSEGDVNFLHISQFIRHKKIPQKNYRLQPDLKLFISASEEDSTSSEVSSRPMISDRASPRILQKVRGWFDECNSQQHLHAQCSPQVPVTLPTRLIDVGSEPWPDIVRLRNSQPSEKGRYATLSYCWGATKNFTTTKESLASIQEGVPISVLPQTLQDAVTVTRELGLCYLWVDALCIIQDDPEDKAREIHCMDNIYMNSAVTIGAASSTTVEEGFLKTASAETWKLPFRCKDGTLGTLAIQHTIRYSPTWEPLFRRAWALQEDILSPRVLDYETWDTRWRCGSASLPEEYNAVLRISNKSKILYTPKTKLDAEIVAFAHSWSQIIADYSRRNLTFHEDKLPAIAGVAREAQRKWGLTYVAGMWQECLLNHLEWTVFPPDQNVRVRRPPTRYAAPSWSWASCDYAVSMSFAETIRAELISCVVEPAYQSAPMGEVLFGKLTVFAPLLKVSSIAEKPGARWRVIADDGSGDIEAPLNQRSHWYMWVSGIYPAGLVLQEAAPAVYRRIGRFCVFNDREGDRIFAHEEWFPKEFTDKSCKKVFSII